MPSQTRARPQSSTRSSVKWRDEAIVDLLAKVQRCRPLDADEESLLERTVRRIRPKRVIWYWSADDDRKIKDLMARRRRRGIRSDTWPRFKRNEEIRLLAIQLGRTEWAVRRRMERLKKAGRKGKRKAKPC